MAIEGSQRERPPETFMPSKEMLLKLFTQEELTAMKPETLTEEFLAKAIWTESEKRPDLKEKIKKIVSAPDEPKEFRDWLNKWMSKLDREITPDSAETAPKKGISIDIEPPKPPGEEAPPEGSSSTLPVGDARPPADGQPGAPGQPNPDDPSAPPGTDKPKYDPALDQASVKHIKNEDLFKTILERGSALFEGLKGLGASFSTMFAGPKLTPTQVKEVKVDLEKNKETKYTSDNRSVEYVCSILNLPVQPSAEKLLALLKATPDFVYETDKNQFKELKVGDILFFQKTEKPGVPYSAGVVSKLEPLSMRLVQNAGVAQEIQINTSTEFQSEWLGFMRIPQNKEVKLPPQ